MMNHWLATACKPVNPHQKREEAQTLAESGKVKEERIKEGCGGRTGLVSTSRLSKRNMYRTATLLPEYLTTGPCLKSAFGIVTSSVLWHHNPGEL